MSYSSRGRGDRGGYGPRGDRGGSDGRARGRAQGGYDDRGGSRGSPRGGGGGGSSHYRGPSAPQGGKQPAVSQEVLFQGKCIIKPAVRKFEDQCVEYNSSHRKDTGDMPFRPDYGTKGREIDLRANFYEIEIQPDAVFYCYRIELKPENPPKRLVKEAFYKLMHETRFKQHNPTTDGTTEIVTVIKMEDLSEIPLWLSGNKNGRDDPDGETPKQKFMAKPIESGVVNHNHLLNALRERTLQGKLEYEDVAIRLLNIIMSKTPYDDEGTVITGKTRNKYFWIDRRKQSAPLGGGLECIRGFYSSVRLSAGRILLNLNVNHSAFFVPGELSTLFRDFDKAFGQDLRLLNRYIRGVRVELTHLPKEKDETGKLAYRTKPIWGLATPLDGKKSEYPSRVSELGAGPAKVEFFWRDHKDDKAGKSGRSAGRWITVEAYFKRQYNIELKNARWPVINTGNTEKPVYLPLDVCRVSPGQISNGELCTSQRQAIIGFSCRRPPDNFQSITTDGLKMMGADMSATETLGLKIQHELIGVPGRILNAPTLRYGKRIENPRYGSWNLRDQKFCKGMSASSWAVLNLYNRGTAPDPTKAIQSFVRNCTNLGLMLNGNPQVTALDMRNMDLRTKLKNMFTGGKSRGFQFALILLPSSEERVFSDVKYAGDVKSGLLTHCCLADKFLKGNDQYMANNAMKVNLKLGGVNQTLEQPKSSRLIDAGKTMIVGLDVTHPSATDPTEFPSIACIVASIDKHLGQWPGQAQVQDGKMEFIQKLPEMLTSCLNRWRKINKQYPDNIIVYRDGVSEGQFNMVANEEYRLMRVATDKLYHKPPAITIIVCGKRHNVRFFPTNVKDVDRTSNPINGTVVDRGITRAVWWDFYLQAQAPLQGSARPAHYVVVRDGIFTNPTINREGKPSDVVQELTHNICYMMGRCTRSISYSTPAFLADRFCDRARRYVRSEIAKQIAEQEAVDGKKSNISLDLKPDIVKIHDSLVDHMVYI